MSFVYPRGVRFTCERCALCCGDTEYKARLILLLRTEAEEISEKTLINVTKFAEKTEGFEPYTYVMKKTEDGRCIFLGNKLCSIYEMRPLICRFYPFQLTNLGNGKYGFMHTKECPGVGNGRLLRRTFFEEMFGVFIESMRKDSATKKTTSST